MHHNIKEIEKKGCTGCGLCSLKCPLSCIAMIPDSEGFLVPELDEKQCVDCGLCLKNCPAVNTANLFLLEERKYYACIASDAKLLLRSSSGGVFGTLADAVLKCNGYVCGCVYNSNMEPVHILTDSSEDVLRMYGSKYVQSKAFGIFLEVQKKLQESRIVFFTGTACQIVALRKFLGKDYATLYTAEILCHGVPSPGLLKIYIDYLEKKNKGKVLDIQFRNKERDGWGSEHRTCVIYQDANGQTHQYRPVLPAYFSAFFYGLNLRYSCYQCKFARSERVADLTMGDYWGSWKKYAKRYDEGISVISVNSMKGKWLAEQMKENSVLFEELAPEEAMWSNDNFLHPVPLPPERVTFYKDLLERKGYKGLWKKAYLTKTYRKKTLASIYGALVPAKIRFALQRYKLKRKRKGNCFQ